MNEARAEANIDWTMPCKEEEKDGVLKANTKANFYDFVELQPI